MPAKSKAQQRLFGMALAVKRGEKKLEDLPKGVRDKIKDIVDNMTEKEIKKFTKLKEAKVATRLPSFEKFIND